MIKTDLIKQLECEGKRVNKRRMIRLGLVAGAFLLFSISYLVPGAMAEDIYPAKKITFVCGSTPGGGFDSFARLLAPFFAKHLAVEHAQRCK